MKNWQKYSGNLDIESNQKSTRVISKNFLKEETSGTRSYYTEFQENEIMFHVSTLLPKKMNENPIEIKKYFGNDIVVIVFFEGKKTFDPSLVVSNFNRKFFQLLLSLFNSFMFKKNQRGLYCCSWKRKER